MPNVQGACMRRIVSLIVALALLMPLPVRAQSNLPPHAWLFGAWVGGFIHHPVLSARRNASPSLPSSSPATL
jgi:hypothetical protein